jgi:hypothetical protein
MSLHFQDKVESVEEDIRRYSGPWEGEKIRSEECRLLRCDAVLLL